MLLMGMIREILVKVIYVIFLTHIQNVTTIGRIVSEITSLTKMDTDDRQTDKTGKTDENGTPRFSYSRLLELMPRLENMNVVILSMDSISYYYYF